MMNPPSLAAKRIAALDVGSLTVRLAIAERAAGGHFRLLQHRREITGLGRGLAQTGELAEEDMATTLEALRDFQIFMADYGVAAYQAVGTQALRQAKNRQVFLDRVRDTLGLAVEVLAPEEEARLSLKGVLSALDPKYWQGPVLVFDVGGGSSEFALARPGQEPVFASQPLGVLTLSQARPLGDPPAPEEVVKLHEEITQTLRRFRDRTFGSGLPAGLRLVGTAGAATTLAAVHLRLSVYDPNKVNNLILSRSQLEQLTGLLSRLSNEERAKLPGIEPAKAGVMVAGTLIIQAILEVFEQDSLVVVDAGLLEGVLESFAF